MQPDHRAVKAGKKKQKKKKWQGLQEANKALNCTDFTVITCKLPQDTAAHLKTQNQYFLAI